MTQSIQAIYENGLLRPLAPLNLPENSVVEIEVRDMTQDDDKEKWLNDFDEWMKSLDSDTPNLTNERISRESIYEEQIQRHL